MIVWCSPASENLKASSIPELLPELLQGFWRLRELSKDFSNVNSINGFSLNPWFFSYKLAVFPGRHCTVWWKVFTTTSSTSKLWMENPCKGHQQTPWILLWVTTFRNFPLSSRILHTTVPPSRIKYFSLLGKKGEGKEEICEGKKTFSN